MFFRSKTPSETLKRILTMSRITETGPHLMVIKDLWISATSHSADCWWNLDFFVSAAQEQSNAYASSSYSTPLIPPPAAAAPQENLAGPQKNGDPNAQGHAVVTFSTANTCDTATIHTGAHQHLMLLLSRTTATFLFMSTTFFFFFNQRLHQEKSTTRGT